ncbi:MAG: DUF4975 domain-containing protein [Bacteroidales bacterium]|nr:DUF4975 domain-containing protein [Bacteroidales bacterium]
MKKMIFPLLLLTLLSAFSCQKEAVAETPRDWDGTVNYFAPTEPYAFDTYYKPYAGYVADPMPFYDPASEEFKVFYLQDYRPNPVATYHPIWGVSTRDAAHYISMGEVIPCGTREEQDAALGTGCFCYNPQTGVYYCYYTGHKYELSASDSREIVMRARSTDLKTWTKDRCFFLKGETDGYSGDDFRDPCIFRDDDGRWHMVVTTRKDGRNLFAEYTSDDLESWSHQGVFMYTAWNRFFECPDVFKMGGYWYLIYSDMFDDGRMVKYVMGSTLAELKGRLPKDGSPVWPDNKEGTLDSRLMYAAKTASDGTTRYIWGWCPTRGGNNNTTYQGWAGNLVAHTVVQNSDGTLRLTPVAGIAEKYSTPYAVKCMQKADSVSESGGTYTINGDGHILFNRLPACARVQMRVECPKVICLGFARGIDVPKFYSLIINPEDGGARRKINFEENGEGGQGFIGGSDSYLFDKPADDIYNLDLYIDNSVFVLYINNKITYTNRLYGAQRNAWSISSWGDGIWKVSDIRISTVK